MTLPSYPIRSSALVLSLALVVVMLPVEPVSAEELAPAAQSASIDGVEQRLDGQDPPAGPSSPDTSSEPRTTDVIEAPIPFVGLGIRGDGTEPELRIRSLDVDGDWDEWVDVELLDGFDGPDAGTSEARDASRQQVDWTSDAIWAGPSSHVQLQVLSGEPHDVEITFIDTAGLSETVMQRIGRFTRSLGTHAPAQASQGGAGQPRILSRKAWGADESWRSGGTTTRTVQHAVLHHTATMNNYTREQAPQQVRNMYYWHTKGNGWNDLGYNFVVDRFGTIYEGRHGGIDRGVQGAHAGGWNSGSVGVALMGNFNDVRPTATMLESASELLAWKYALHGVDPTPGARVTRKGERIRTLEGHRNLRGSYVEWSGSAGFKEDCPGSNLGWRIADRLPNRIAARYASLVAPTFNDLSGSPFTAEIAWMASAGLSTGWPDGSFRPAADVSRQAAVTFLHNLAGAPAPATAASDRFTDVAADHPFGAAIAWAAETGITVGWPDGTFRPNAPVTRQAAARFLSSYDGGPLPRARAEFHDVSTAHNFARDITWMADERITRGFPDGNFHPTRTVTRQAMAAFLFRLDG